MTEYLPIFWGHYGTNSRAAVQMTWASDTTIKHVSALLRRQPMSAYDYDNEVLEWKFYEGSTGDATGLTNANLKASGTWTCNDDTVWPPFAARWMTAVFTDPVVVSSSKYYWLVVKTVNDFMKVHYRPGWEIAYDSTGAPSGYGQLYFWTTAGGWVKISDHYARYLVTDPQAGVKYHVVIDGQGYMTPDNLGSYSCQLATPFGGNLRGGMQKYSQLQYPYSSFSQETFRHGMGWLYFEDPETFYFGHGLDMRVDGQTILAPLSVYTPVQGEDADYHLPDDREPIDLPWPDHSTVNHPVQEVAQSFVLAANDTLRGICLMLRQNWMGGTMNAKIYVSLYHDNAGEPGTLIEKIEVTSDVFQWMEWIWADFADYTAGETDETLWFSVDTDATQMSAFQIWADPNAGHSGKFMYCKDDSWVEDTNYDLIFIINGSHFIQDWSDKEHPRFFQEFKSNLYFAYHQKIYKWNETATKWEVVDTVSGQECKSLASFADYLYASWGSDHVTRRTSDGTTWTDVTGDNAELLWVGQGYIWKQDATNKHKVYYSNDGTTWSAAISIGTSDYDVTGFCIFNDVVVVAKEDGLYYIDQDHLAHSYFIYRDQADANNGKNLHVWSNNVYIPIHSGLWRWTGSSVDTVGPDMRAGMPRYWRGRVADMVSFGNWMFAAYDTEGVEGSYSSLLAYNGIGWHNFNRGGARSTYNRLTALYITTDIGGETRLWMSRNYRVEYIVLSTQTNNHFEWPDAKYETEGWMVTPWWDGGLYNAKKYFNDVTFVADGLDSDTYIEIYYQLDGEPINGTHYYLGTLDENSANPQTFHISDDSEGYSIRFIFYFFTRNSKKTPRLRSYNCEALVRPPSGYVYSAAITLADNVRLMDGTQETASADTLWTHLQTAQAKTAPILIYFPFKAVRGFVSAIQERTSSYKEQGDNPSWERVALVSFVEA